MKGWPRVCKVDTRALVIIGFRNCIWNIQWSSLLSLSVPRINKIWNILWFESYRQISESKQIKINRNKKNNNRKLTKNIFRARTLMRKTRNMFFGVSCYLITIQSDHFFPAFKDFSFSVCSCCVCVCIFIFSTGSTFINHYLSWYDTLMHYFHFPFFFLFFFLLTIGHPKSQ